MDDISEKFILFSGCVSNLHVLSSAEDFILGSSGKTLAGSAATGLVIAGVAGAAVTSLQAATNTGDRVQYFQCEVEDKNIIGCFSLVFFEEGDQVDVVAEPQDNNTYYAYAIRRPIDHRLWLHPHSNKGRIAHIFHRNKISFSIGLVFFFFFLLIRLIKGNGSLSYNLMSISMAFLVSLSISLFTYFYLSKGWHKYCELAENIFLTLGYREPKKVNMDKENSLYLKECLKHGRNYFVPESKQDSQSYIAPWVYRYRSAPEIPESSKLKE